MPVRNVKIKNFHCSIHGYVKPIPECPECLIVPPPTQSSEELRKDWLNFYAKLAIEPIHVGVVAKQTIADWWLPKLSQRDADLLAEIERMKSLDWVIREASNKPRSKMTPDDYSIIAHNIAIDQVITHITNRDKK